MTVKQLKKAIKDAPDNSRVYFDSEAVCFDQHLIDVARATIQTYDGEDMVILSFMMSGEDRPKFHFNKD